MITQISSIVVLALACASQAPCTTGTSPQANAAASAPRSGLAHRNGSVVDSTWPWHFGFKSGRLTARTRLVAPPGLDADSQTTSEVTVVFDDYGRLLRSEGTVDGHSIVALLRGDSCTIYDPATHQMMARQRDLTMERIGVEPLSAVSFRYLQAIRTFRTRGTEKILGLDATEYAFDQPESSTRLWMWKGMLLRMEQAAGPMKRQQMYEVTGIDSTAAVDPALFTPPADLKPAAGN
ncbi:MAG TPA: hypothetical protein VHI13_05700 [Candidatus Kapabacteria bacterium]|nr:hypothetical protein [Candidatus Kapabacteria bacterium]